MQLKRALKCTFVALLSIGILSSNVYAYTGDAFLNCYNLKKIVVSKDGQLEENFIYPAKIGEEVVEYVDGGNIREATKEEIANKIVEPLAKEVEKNMFYYKDNETGVILEAKAGVLPNNTNVIVKKLQPFEDNEDDENYENAMERLDKDKLRDLENADIYSIYIQDEKKRGIKPNGKVLVMFPIGEDFDENDLEILQIVSEEDVEYKKEIATIDGKKYCTFETDHFSIYCLYDRLRQHDYMEYSLKYTNISLFILLTILFIIIYKNRTNV